MGNDLFNVSKDKYGDQYQNHLLDQYKLYIESIEKTSDRRNLANNFYIVINSGIVASFAFCFDHKMLEIYPLLKIIFCLAGLFISFLFWYLINSYKQLNTAKFEVLHQIEKKLPLSLYKYEWKALGEGKDSKKYRPFSHLELIIPFTLGLLYLVLLLIFVFAPNTFCLCGNS